MLVLRMGSSGDKNVYGFSLNDPPDSFGLDFSFFWTCGVGFSASSVISASGFTGKTASDNTSEALSSLGFLLSGISADMDSSASRFRSLLAHARCQIRLL